MDDKKNARQQGRAKELHNGEARPRGEAMQAPRPARPDTLKAAIDPAEFYQREIENVPALRASGDGWTQNFPCVFHEDKTGSFGVNLRTGAFRCFGCDAQGGSVIDFVMLRDGLTLDQARTDLGQRYSILPDQTPREPPRRPTKPRPAAPVPTHANLDAIPPAALASRPQAHPRHGTPSGTWTYPIFVSLAQPAAYFQ